LPCRRDRLQNLPAIYDLIVIVVDVVMFHLLNSFELLVVISESSRNDHFHGASKIRRSLKRYQLHRTTDVASRWLSRLALGEASRATIGLCQNTDLSGRVAAWRAAAAYPHQ
jgi:hypothetical protein